MSVVAPLLVQRFEKFFGRPPTRNEAELLMSQIQLETGQSGYAINHFNVGNISAGRSYIESGKAFWRPPWYDPEEFAKQTNAARKARYEATHQKMLNHKAPYAFRAYPSLVAGVDGYVGTVFRMHKPIVEAAATGDAGKFARSLLRYCPDCDPSRTTRTLSGLQKKIHESGQFAGLKEGGGGTGSGGPFGSSPPGERQQPSTSPPSIASGAAELPTLRYGARGLAVAALQRLLQIDRDGSFGPLTLGAVREFQSSQSLARDGVVGAHTWFRLVVTG